MKIETLREREKQHAKGVNGFPTTEEEAALLLDLPRDLENKTLIDLGARMSTLVPGLLDKGLDVYAVDSAYFEPHQQILGVELNTLGQRTIENPAINPPSERPILMGDSLDWAKSSEKADVLARARQRICSNWSQFNWAYGEYRERFVEAWFSELPFEDNTADFVVSVDGLSRLGPQIRLDAYEYLIREGLRVVNKGGSLVTVSRSGVSIDEKVAERLGEEDGYKISLEKVSKPYQGGERMRIVKVK